MKFNDSKHEEIKRHAALYICAHKELLQKPDYLIAYNKLLEEYARDYAYHVLEKPITVVSDEERAFLDSALDFEFSIIEKNEVQNYICTVLLLKNKLPFLRYNFY